jgi:hypothetical protein
MRGGGRVGLKGLWGVYGGGRRLVVSNMEVTFSMIRGLGVVAANNLSPRPVKP